MKSSLLIASTILALSSSSLAATYSCQSLDRKTRANFSLNNPREISWTDLSHSAKSVGKFVGIDRAPFSERKGELQFALTDFFRTADQGFVLSAPRSVLTGPRQVRLTVYFDNDGHDEEVTRFNCLLGR